MSIEKSTRLTDIQLEKKDLLKIYQCLYRHYGNRNWWPADSPFEVIIGAILTQNVSWPNAKKAINNLKSKNLLDAQRLNKSDATEIAPLIISSRYYNMKAQKIKNFLDFFFEDYNGDLISMSNDEMIPLRKKLLKIKGLGEETVDSILLYACGKPIFVVDAYTKRIFSRYGFVDENARYRDVQSFFMDNLPEDIELYNDFHAQVVHLGNLICKRQPECDKCPIKKINNKIKCRYNSVQMIGTKNKLIGSQL